MYMFLMFTVLSLVAILAFVVLLSILLVHLKSILPSSLRCVIASALHRQCE